MQIQAKMKGKQAAPPTPRCNNAKAASAILGDIDGDYDDLFKVASNTVKKGQGGEVQQSRRKNGVRKA